MANILIAYFSMKGQTIGPGMRIVNQNKGNTQVVAEYIQKAVGGELFEIVPDKAYNTDHMALIEEAKQELNAGIRVPVRGYPEDMRRYDIVFIGFPNWWNSLPMPVVTFLENIDLSGKKVIPFITSEGSGWGSTLSEIKGIVKNADFGEGLSLQGSKAGASEKKVGEWARKQI